MTKTVPTIGRRAAFFCLYSTKIAKKYGKGNISRIFFFMDVI